MKWLIVKENSVWQIKYKTTQKNLPRGKEAQLISGVDTKWPKINISPEGHVTIIEDEVKKQTHLDKKESEKNNKLEADKIKKALTQLNTDIDNASNITDFKVILKRIIKVFPYLLREINN